MIKRFKEYNDNEKTLTIFDFDDTLVDSPSFNELAINYLKEDITIKDLLNQSINRVGVKLDDLKWQDGRIYVIDPNKELKAIGNWVRKGDRLYMFTPNAFHLADLSLPSELKELSDLYKSIDNKCIVTAREESLRYKITRTLFELGLELPKYGLHMAPVGTKNAGNWKGEKIVEIINETGFKKAIFYEDNIKYIKRATKIVKEKLPNFDFTPIKVL